MKKRLSWTVIAFVFSLVAMLAINWKQTHDVQRDIQYGDVQLEKQKLANHMILTLERYRRKSTSFRKLPEQEIVATKASLKNEMLGGVDKLEAEATKPEEKTLLEQVRNEFGEFLVTAAKLEPMLFTRDVYQKQQIQDIHESMVHNLTRVGELAQQQAISKRQELGGIWTTGMQALAVAAALALLFVLLTFYRDYRVYVRPLRYLRKRAREISSGRFNAAGAHRLPEHYAEIEGVMKDLAATVEMHRAEKHGFITAVAMELRPPLLSLQSGKGLAASLEAPQTTPQGLNARRVVESAIYRLSRALEDLTDIVETDYGRIRLNENIVDARDLLAQTAHALSTPGNRHEVTLSVPSIPIWISVDTQRMERVIVNLVSKMMQLQPAGGKVQIIVCDPSANSQGGGSPGVSAHSGLEILIQDGESGTAERRAAAPELDLIRHWVSQNGFGMSLAHKIMKAHGGSITAAGVAGTRVAFTIRLPRERVATGLLSSAWVEQNTAPSASLTSPGLQGARPGVKPDLTPREVQ